MYTNTVKTEDKNLNIKFILCSVQTAKLHFKVTKYNVLFKKYFCWS